MTLRYVYSITMGVVACAYFYASFGPRLWRGDTNLVSGLRRALSTYGVSPRISRRILGAIPTAGVAFSLLTLTSLSTRLERLGHTSIGAIVPRILFVMTVLAGIAHLLTLLVGRPRVLVCPEFRDPR